MGLAGARRYQVVLALLRVLNVEGCLNRNYRHFCLFFGFFLYHWKCHALFTFLAGSACWKDNAGFIEAAHAIVATGCGPGRCISGSRLGEKSRSTPAAMSQSQKKNGLFTCVELHTFGPHFVSSLLLLLLFFLGGGQQGERLWLWPGPRSKKLSLLSHRQLPAISASVGCAYGPL